MIHWGDSIPCSLFINQSKAKDIFLPNSTSWEVFSKEVSRNFNINPSQWQYTYSSLNCVWQSDIASEEMFVKVKSAYSVESNDVLKINVCDSRSIERIVRNGDETDRINNADWGLVNMAHGESENSGHYSQRTVKKTMMELSAETAVQKYLAEEGGELLRKLVLANNVCCCNMHEERRSPEEFLSGNTEMGRADNDLSPIVKMARTMATSSVLAQPDSTPDSTHDRDALVVPSAPPAITIGQSRKLDEFSSSSSNKRLKSMLGDREYLLAPCQNTNLAVIPGQVVTSSWTLVTKHRTCSRWEVVDDGGTLPLVGQVTWSPSSTPNIMTFSADFRCPSREGEFNSTWCLVQDGIRREVFVFCCVQVQLVPLKKASGAGLAAHGNIPLETAVPKMLNSNKVFCMSRDAAYRNVPDRDDNNNR